MVTQERFTKELKEALEREFDGMPVVDAEHDARLAIMPADIKGAVKKDFGKCVFANACKRQFGSEKVIFLRSVAYVAIPDENGNKRVERFVISSGGRELIKGFDKTGKSSPGGAFILKAPKGSQKLESIRERSRKALLNGRIRGVGDGSQAGRIGKPKVADHTVRNGTGLIHMAMKKKAA